MNFYGKKGRRFKKKNKKEVCKGHKAKRKDKFKKLLPEI